MAPEGTVSVNVVDVAAVTVAGTALLNSTWLFVAIGSNRVPLMTRLVPTVALLRLKPVMVGSITAKEALLVAVPVAVTIVIGAVVVFGGTVTVRAPYEDAVILAAGVPGTTPLLNVTVLVALKPRPVIVTDDPTRPEAGVKLLISGQGTIWRTVAFPLSATNSVPAASTAIPCGALKRAAASVPSALPALLARPASVLMVPSGAIWTIVLAPVLATYT